MIVSPKPQIVRTAAVLLFALTALSGCAESNWKQFFGMERESPDEFQVSTHPPLTIPPDFNLRPPQPDAPNPQETPPHDQAAEAVLGTAPVAHAAPPAAAVVTPAAPASAVTLPATVPVTTPAAAIAPAPVKTSASPAESALLKSANVQSADPMIRQELRHDSNTPVVDVGPSLLQSLLFGTKAPPPGQVVDASGEAARLQQNAAIGAPVTSGNTPIIERRAQAPLEGMIQ